MYDEDDIGNDDYYASEIYSKVKRVKLLLIIGAIALVLAIAFIFINRAIPEKIVYLEEEEEPGTVTSIPSGDTSVPAGPAFVSGDSDDASKIAEYKGELESDHRAVVLLTKMSGRIFEMTEEENKVYLDRLEQTYQEYKATLEQYEIAEATFSGTEEEKVIDEQLKGLMRQIDIERNDWKKFVDQIYEMYDLILE